MKPEEALNLLDRAVSLLNASRQDHINIQNAITVLKETITPKEKIEKK